MASLHPDILSAACRELYQRAGETFILPDLIRAAEGERPRRRLEIPTGEGVVVLIAEIDPAQTDRSHDPAAPLPLQITVHLEREGEALRLCRRQRDEAVRAFLMGAKAPLSLEPVDQPGRFRLSLQLAPRYSCGCGEIEAPVEGREQLARALADALYQRTAHFFADPHNGRAVWDIRAAQELFGDPKPAPEAFWPVAAPDDETPEEASVPANQASAPSRMERCRRLALAAGIATLALGASVYVMGANRDSYLRRAPMGDAAMPAAMPGPMPAAKPGATPDLDKDPSPRTAPVSPPPAPPLMFGAPRLPPPVAAPSPAKEQTPVRKAEPLQTRLAAAKPVAPPKPPVRTASVPRSSGKGAIATLNGVVRDIERLPQKIAAVVRTSQTH